MTDRQYQRKLNRIKKQGERYKQEKELRDAYAEFMPEKKERKVSNIMLVVIVIAIVGYTVASFWLTYITGVSIDSTLTTCFYAFMSSEIVALAGIKCSKVIKGHNQNENDNSNIDFSETTDDSSYEDDSCG